MKPLHGFYDEKGGWHFGLVDRALNRIGIVRLVYGALAVCSVLGIALWVGLGAVFVHFVVKFWK